MNDARARRAGGWQRAAAALLVLHACYTMCVSAPRWGSGRAADPLLHQSEQLHVLRPEQRAVAQDQPYDVAHAEPQQRRLLRGLQRPSNHAERDRESR